MGKPGRNSIDKLKACAVWGLVISFTVLCCLWIGGWFSSVDQFGPAMKVMSFNIRYGTAEDGDNHWDLRRELVRETIRVFDPDLLGLQEALKFQGEHLQQQFPEYQFVGRGRDEEPDQGEFSPVMFRRDRFELIDSGHFWLSENPDEPGSQGWDAALPRMVTWVRLRDRAHSGAELVFANTHFDHKGSDARAGAAQLIRHRLIDNDATPLILAGDFNTACESAPWQSLIGDAENGQRTLIDSYRVIFPTAGNEGTSNHWIAKRDGPRIDWILHSQEFVTVNAGINYHNLRGRYPSDHYPVQAVLRLLKE
ncbi:MAG: endonuclease/exonuclease/phosphatase family protein [Pirellulaceae bacterium]